PSCFTLFPTRRSSDLVDIVTERRKLPRDKVVELADGRIYTGRQALSNKLIDEIGGEQEAIDWLEKKRHIAPDLDVKDVKLEKDKDRKSTRLNSSHVAI